jgi:hypothetical protein
MFCITMIVDGFEFCVEAVCVSSQGLKEGRTPAPWPPQDQEHLSRLNKATDVVENLDLLPGPAGDEAHDELGNGERP